MKIPYNFANLISGRHYASSLGWIDTPEEMRERNLEKFKEFLVSCTRNGSEPRKAIERMSLSNLPKNGEIFKRLEINHKGNVEYTAGQDYTAEMKTIKDIIKKEC